MKLVPLSLFLLFLGSCSESPTAQSPLQSENDSLKQQITALEEQLQTLDITPPSTRVTLANTEIKTLTSKFNQQTYQLKISYPKSYFKEPERKFPVLYVLDAETNFGGVSYIVQRLIKDRLIPEILVVGIAYDTDYKNFYRLRSRDLTPVEDSNLKMGKNEVDPTGGAPLFSKFLEQELFPFIEKVCRIQPKDRAIYGHSYGGLFGSYVLLEQPNLFKRYLLLGPSLWYKDKLLVNQAAAKTLSLNQDTRLYMGSGALDLRIQEYQEEFVQLLRAKQLTDLKIDSEVVANETHRTIFGVGFTNGLRFIYKE